MELERLRSDNNASLEPMILAIQKEFMMQVRFKDPYQLSYEQITFD